MIPFVLAFFMQVAAPAPIIPGIDPSRTAAAVYDAPGLPACNSGQFCIDNRADWERWKCDKGWTLRAYEGKYMCLKDEQVTTVPFLKESDIFAIKIHLLRPMSSPYISGMTTDASCTITPDPDDQDAYEIRCIRALVAPVKP